MTIDANLIEGLKIGFAIGFVCGLVFSFTFWILVKVATKSRRDDRIES